MQYSLECPAAIPLTVVVFKGISVITGISAFLIARIVYFNSAHKCVSSNLQKIYEPLSRTTYIWKKDKPHMMKCAFKWIGEACRRNGVLSSPHYICHNTHVISALGKSLNAHMMDMWPCKQTGDLLMCPLHMHSQLHSVDKLQDVYSVNMKGDRYTFKSTRLICLNAHFVMCGQGYIKLLSCRILSM